MSPRRRVVLFDLFGVLAQHQQPGAMTAMAARCGADPSDFAVAYWALRAPYDAGQQTATEYWTAVLDRTSQQLADPDTIEVLRLADIGSWSRIDARMVGYALSLRARAEVALLSNIPADHADTFRAAQPWLDRLDYVALSGKIGVAKPDAAAFEYCINLAKAAPSDFYFIDDREQNVRAAQQVGMHGQTFTTIDSLIPALDHWLIDNSEPDPTPL